MREARWPTRGEAVGVAGARPARRRRQEDGRPGTERGKEASGRFRVFALSAWLHSIVALRVLCLSGRSRAPLVRNFKGSLSLSSIFWGVSTFTRAAASSMAKGSPSRRAQISAMAGAFSLVTSKFAFAALALSTKSFTASYWVKTSREVITLRSGKDSGGTRYSCSR